MNSGRVRASLVIFGILGAGDSLVAQQPLQETMKVRLSVDAAPALRDEITSYLGRELRSLQDIRIVDQDADYILYVGAMTVSTKAGATIGVAISAVLVVPYKFEHITGLLTNMTQDQWHALEASTVGQVFIDQTALFAGALGDIPELCKKIIVRLDASSFEPTRKALRLFERQKQ
jgi:hypothetical protein